MWSDGKRAFKVVQLRNRRDIRDLRLECEYGQRAFEFGVGPRLYHCWTMPPNWGVIEMQQMQMTLRQYLTKVSPHSHSWVPLLEQRIRQLNQAGMYCVDLALRNAMLNVNKRGAISQLRLVDFGSDYCDQEKRNPLAIPSMLAIFWFNVRPYVQDLPPLMTWRKLVARHVQKLSNKDRQLIFFEVCRVVQVKFQPSRQTFEKDMLQ